MVCKVYWLPRVNIVVDELIVRFKDKVYKTIIMTVAPHGLMPRLMPDWD